MHLSALNVYPVKSCAGIRVERWPLDALGLRYDRRWMVLTPEGRPVSQRECPALALVVPEIRPPHLVLRAPGRKELIVALEPMGGRPVHGEIWGDAITGAAPDHLADAWFSDVVEQEVVFAWLPNDQGRPLDPHWAPKGGRTSFTDGYPMLLIGEASLADLNSRLAAPLPMNRFRPSLVVTGSAPFAEDGWGSFRIGGIPMEGVKPCPRCVMTTVDQAAGRRDGDEPLRTLATFRKQEGGVMFGQNVVHYGTGELAVGATVEAGR